MTELGVRMIQEMNSAGILIDLAHTNDPCALDVIEVSEKPVVDTHSNPRSLDPGDRSAPDEVMKALAASGGMLGITPQLSRAADDAPYRTIPRDELDKTLKFVAYAVDLMGIDGVGIGTHFNSAALPWITEALLNAGYSDEDTAKIMGGNQLRVLREVLPGE
jgi:membrane dipeptidase